LMSKQASTINIDKKAHAGMWYLVFEIELGLVGLCLQGDGSKPVIVILIIV